MTGAAALAVAIAGVVLQAGRGPGHRAPAADPLDAMAPGQAYDRAVALAAGGNTAESLPYYRRALRGVNEDFWQLHCNYASALYNLTIEIGTRRGVPMGATRSTIERAALVREATAEFDRALALAAAPHDRAIVLGLVGQMMHVYGFPWEAFTAYRRAQFADPSDPALAARANLFQSGLERPATTAPSGMGDQLPEVGR